MESVSGDSHGTDDGLGAWSWRGWQGPQLLPLRLSFRGPPTLDLSLGSLLLPAVSVCEVVGINPACAFCQ